MQEQHTSTVKLCSKAATKVGGNSQQFQLFPSLFSGWKQIRQPSYSRWFRRSPDSLHYLSASLFRWAEGRIQTFSERAETKKNLHIYVSTADN